MSSIWTIRRSTSDVKLAGLCGASPGTGASTRCWSASAGHCSPSAGGGRDPVRRRVAAATGRRPRDRAGGRHVRRRGAQVAARGVGRHRRDRLRGRLRPVQRRSPRSASGRPSWSPWSGTSASTASGPPRRTRRRRPTAPPAVPAPPAAPFRYPGPPTPFTEAAEAWQRRIAEYQATQPATFPRSRRGRPAARQRWPRRSRRLRTRPLRPPPRSPSPTLSRCSGRPSWPLPTRWASMSSRRVERPRAAVRPGQRPSARRLRWAALLALGLTMAGLGIADNLGRGHHSHRVRRRRAAGHRGRPGAGHLVGPGPRAAAGGGAARRRGAGPRRGGIGHPGADGTVRGPRTTIASPQSGRLPAER